MANQLYSADRVKFINGGFNWPSLPARLDAWRGSYVFDEAHASIADITAAGGVQVVVGLALSGKIAKPGGYAASNPAILPTVPVGAPVTFLVLMDTTGTPVPIAYIDDAQGLPFTPNGLDQVVQPDWLQLRGWFRA